MLHMLGSEKYLLGLMFITITTYPMLSHKWGLGRTVCTQIISYIVEIGRLFLIDFPLKKD